MSCIHEASSFISAGTAELLAGPSLNGETSWFGITELKATARLHQKKDIELGDTCRLKATASIAAQEGDGQFSIASKMWGYASIDADAVTDGDPALSIATLTGTASVDAESSVIKNSCLDCCNCDAFIYAEPEFYHEFKAHLYAFADMHRPNWQIEGAAALSDSASSMSADPDVIWSAETIGTFVGEAFIGPAGPMEAASDMFAYATTVTGTGFLFYTSGLLQLTGIALAMQNYLPQYMAEGEIIKRIINAIGDDLERATYARDGYPS